MNSSDQASRLQRLRDASAAALAERATSYSWTDAHDVLWKVSPDGIWRFDPHRWCFVFSGWKSAVSDQLLGTVLV